MGPKKTNKNPRNETPTKTGSSQLKPDSRSEVTDMTDAMEASNSAALSQSSRVFEEEHEDVAPLWFQRYFKEFEWRMEAMPVSKLKDQDDKINSVQFDCNANAADIKTLSSKCKELEDKLDDIENRARRNNIVIYGVPDNGERENTRDVLQHVLADFVDVNPEIVNKIQRGHRTPTFPPPGMDITQKHRMIHVAFPSYLHKELVRKQCIAKFKNQEFQGRKLFVSDDFSKKIIEKLKRKMQTFKNLQKEGKKPFFIFPDVIKYRDGDGKLITV